MAHLYSLSINHFRGVEHLDVTFGSTNFVVIIGRGDSGKTTILKAIAAGGTEGQERNGGTGTEVNPERNHSVWFSTAYCR